MTDPLSILAGAAGVSPRPGEAKAVFRLRVIECASIMPNARWLLLPIEVQDFYNREAERVNAESVHENQRTAPRRPQNIPPENPRQRGAKSVTVRAFEIMCLDAELTPPQVYELLIKEGFDRPSMTLLHAARCQTKLMLRIMAAAGRLKTA